MVFQLGCQVSAVSQGHAVDFDLLRAVSRLHQHLFRLIVRVELIQLLEALSVCARCFFKDLNQVCLVVDVKKVKCVFENRVYWGWA